MLVAFRRERLNRCANSALKYTPSFIGTVFYIFWMAGLASAQHSVRITQVDTSGFPKVRVYVSVADSGGNPIPDDLPVQVTLYEDGKTVSQNVLSEGWSVSSVLVLDISGSMNKDDKIHRAKEAAIRYLEIAPSNYRVAAVVFSDAAKIVGHFNVDRNTLRNRLSNLSAEGNTALQDGIALALNMLRSRSDRKAIIVLTDGLENHSSDFKGEVGHNKLLQRAAREGSTISTIGLGTDVDVAYLKSYQRSGGWYLFTPTPNDLQGIFERAVTLLEKERVIEYSSIKADADGSVKSLSLDLRVGDKVSVDHHTYISPGVIPHVRGDHLPYLITLFALLLGPGAFSMAGHFISVYRFRSSNLVRLEPGSPYIGKRDPNVGPKGHPFQEGELIVVCPKSKTPHYVRSWRNNRCRCMREPLGSGSFCYHRKFPRWVRLTFDFLTGSRRSEVGRTWLCWCAGDKEGW